jgi:anti-sigma-K factor RskA
MSDDDKSFVLVHSDDDSSDESSTTSDSFARSDSRGEPLDIEAAQQRQQVDIGGQDSVGVSRWRAMVILMISLTAALVITTTYIFLSREETNEFEKSVRFFKLGREFVAQKDSRRRRTSISSNANTYTLSFILRSVQTKWKDYHRLGAYFCLQHNGFASYSG